MLAGATFVYVTFEFSPVGLIQDIARDLAVPPGRVGLPLISGYAVVAAAVTIPTVALASRVSRGTALVASLVVLVVARNCSPRPPPGSPCWRSAGARRP